MQVNPVFAAYIVLVARVREVVDLYSVHHACADETEAVLPQNDRVDGSLADEKLALEVLGLVDEAGLLIALRID